MVDQWLIHWTSVDITHRRRYNAGAYRRVEGVKQVKSAPFWSAATCRRFRFRPGASIFHASPAGSALCIKSRIEFFPVANGNYSCLDILRGYAAVSRQGDTGDYVSRILKALLNAGYETGSLENGEREQAMNSRLLYLVLNGLLMAALIYANTVTPMLAGQTRDAQKALQHSVASKTAKFGSVSKADETYAGALDAHDLAGAYKKVGQTGAFKGTVSKIFEERDGDLMILDFDPDYRTALTAVLKNPDFPHFPDMKALEGKEIVVSGSFVDYRGKAEIILTDPDQIKIVR